MPHAEDCSIRTRSGLEEVTGLRSSPSDTWRRDFRENPEAGQWNFLRMPSTSAPIPELGSPSRQFFSTKGTMSFEFVGESILTASIAARNTGDGVDPGVGRGGRLAGAAGCRWS